MSFRIVLREGITGGFAGPTTKQVIEINGDGAGATVQHAKLKENSRHDFVAQSGAVSSQQLEALLPTVKDRLQALPKCPPGNEDIYGRDISIAFYSDDFQWENGSPDGCVQRASETPATAEQKQVFDSVVEDILAVGQKYAIQ